MKLSVLRAFVVDRKSQSGQAAMEMALIFMGIVVPMTFGLMMLAQLAWTYHTLATLTRQGARYAATHCWMDSTGSNVVEWMQQNSPPFIDRQQLREGTIQIQINYWTHDLTTHESLEFSCASSCSPACVPDSVTVSIRNYQFKHLLTMLGMSPITVPSFATTMETHSMGATPETIPIPIPVEGEGTP